MMAEQELTVNPQELHISPFMWHIDTSPSESSSSSSSLESVHSSSSEAWGSTGGHSSLHDVVPLDSLLLASFDEKLYLGQLFHSAAQEVERLDKAILDHQIELVQIFQEKQRQIDTLKAQRIRHVTRWKKFFALIYRLPDDVLLMVFEVAVLQFAQSPWNLAHVSRRFREIAFRARKIWARLLLKPGFGGLARNQGGWEICKSLPQLSRSLSRSGGARLSLSIHSCDLDCAKALASHPGSWDTLTYVDHGNQQVDAELFGNRTRLLSVTNLRVIGGGSQQDSQLVEWIQSCPPQELSLTDHSLHLYRRDGNWSNLRTLNIRLPQLGPTAFTWINHSGLVITDILRASQGTLKSVTLENVAFHEISFTAPIELPQVEELSLRCVTQWHLLHAPNATKFSLAFGKGEVYEQTNHLQFTKTVALEFTSSSGTQSRGTLTFPDRDQITVTGTRGWSIDRQGVDTDIPPQPYILHLHDIQISSDDLLRHLRSISSVLELYMHNSAVAPLCFKAFTVDPTSSRLGKPPLLPNLQLLNVQLATNSRAQGAKTKDSYDSTFTKISEVRKKKLGVLKTLMVQYPKDMGSVLQCY